MEEPVSENETWVGRVRRPRPTGVRPRQLVRVYSFKGRVAHLIDVDLPRNGGFVLCNRTSQHWFGTGLDREAHKAARLPVCPKCEAYALGKGWT